VAATSEDQFLQGAAAWTKLVLDESNRLRQENKEAIQQLIAAVQKQTESLDAVKTELSAKIDDSQKEQAQSLDAVKKELSAKIGDSQEELRELDRTVDSLSTTVKVAGGVIVAGFTLALAILRFVSGSIIAAPNTAILLIRDFLICAVSGSL